MFGMYKYILFLHEKLRYYQAKFCLSYHHNIYTIVAELIVT